MHTRTQVTFEDTVRSRLLRLAVLLLLPGLSLAVLVTWQSLDADRAALATRLFDRALLLSADVDAAFAPAEAQLRLLAASDALSRGDIASFTPLAAAAARFGGRIVLSSSTGAWLADTGAAGMPSATPAAGPPAGLANDPPTNELKDVASDTPKETPRDTQFGTDATDRPLIGWGAGPDGPPCGGRPCTAMTVPVRVAGQHAFNLTEFLPASRLRSVLDNAQLRQGWIAVVYDEQLHPVAANEGADRLAVSLSPAEIEAGLRRTSAMGSSTEAPGGAAGLFAAIRSQHLGIPLLVAAPQDHMPSRLSLLLLVSVGGVLVALGLLGALVVSGSISRPIEALAAAARRLGENDVLSAIPGGLIEVDEVARAMTSANRALIDRRAALSEMNATLAARVAARTAELAEANGALEEQRARLGLVLDHMPVGVIVTYADGAAMYSNREGRRLVGVPEHGDVPMGSELVLRRQGIAVPLSESPPALAQRGMVTVRDILTLERPDGEVLDLEVSAGPVLNRDGTVALAVTTLQDVSARLEAEEARRRSQRLEAVGQLTGGVAHEFNNLLMAIGGCLDLLAPHVRGERARGLLENAARAADRGAVLTRQLLAFARRQHLQAEPVDLNALVVSLAELLGTTLGRAIEIATDLAPDCWPAVADATQLELVLLNLAINARDAMPAGGRLVIGTGNAVLGSPRRAEEPPAGEYAVLHVADTGTGMTSDVLARAFEPFFTTKQVGQGTGLGLPHVLGVAQQLGGGVVINSTPGQGTAVHVFLPRAVTTPLPPRATVLSPPRPRALEGLRVLLVDDDLEVRGVARAMLEEMGALVIEAATACDALLMVRTEPGIDLVLADYTMPHMTGLELAEHVGTLLPGVPVVLMTGYSATTLGDISPAVRAVLQKPFRAEAVARVMTQALGGSLATAEE